MYDYREILQLLNQSDRLQQAVEQIFTRNIPQDPTLAEKTLQLKDNLSHHFHKHHPTPLIAETDLNGVILYINEAFAKIAKYEPSELLGQNINILKSSYMLPGIYQQIWEAITVGKTWNGELINRAKDYETFAVESFIAPVFGADGNPERYWCVAFDISERLAQQQELEEKNNDMLESLKYAKRIQKTILPEKELLDEFLFDHFVMYRPKDVVSGDFYWFAHTINMVFVAVVDCTGHGVPGAFMSLIGYNILNSIVNQMGLKQPSLILNELHKQVRGTLKQDAGGENRRRDGMDLALVAIEKFGNEMQYAGANRPLVIVRADGTMEEIKADKMSIGGEQMEDERIFTNHILEMNPGDNVYLYTDGIIDQFGGPDEKKFSNKRLKQFFQDIYEQPMKLQRAQLNLVYKDWIMDGEQIDDVTVMGIKFGGDDD